MWDMSSTAGFDGAGNLLDCGFATLVAVIGHRAPCDV